MMHTPESYRREWSTLTGRSEREVYVPKALRSDDDTSWPSDPVKLAETDPVLYQLILQGLTLGVTLSDALVIMRGRGFEYIDEMLNAGLSGVKEVPK